MKRTLVFLVLLLAARWAAAAPPQPPAPTYSSIVSGSPAGGHKGSGSINAQTYYQNGTLLPPALPLAGGTLTGKLTTTPSSNGGAGFNVSPGIVPASPVDGDMWNTPAGFFGQVNGGTVGPFGAGGGGGGGNVFLSGTPQVNQLAQWVSGVAIRGINLDAAVGGALGNPLNASGGLLSFSLIGTSGAFIPLLNGTNTWSGVQSFNDGDLKLNGSSSGGSVLHAPATGGGALQLPAGATNLGYQVGAIVDQHCLKAFGTAGGFSDAGALCGSGGGGLSQLTGDVLAGPGTGSVVATVVAAPLGGITGMGANVAAALAIPVGTAGAPVVLNGTGGTPSAINLLHGTGLPLSTGGVTGVLPLANGGTGTATPSLVAGTNITLSGAWPNQTINTPLLSTANTWSGVQSFNDAVLALKGATSGTSILRAPATGGGTVFLPATASANMNYQVGAYVDQHCLKAVGTAGGIADAGALCGSGGSGITQLTGGVTAGPGSGSVVATVASAPLSAITGMGVGVPTALAVNVGTAGSPVVNGGALGAPSSGNGGNLTNIPAAALTGVTSVAHGGTGTATPSLVPGTNITITGAWPNQTINTPSGAGTLTGLTAGTPDLVVNGGSPCTSGSCSVATQTLVNTQSGASYTILSSDNTKIIKMTNASATNLTIAVAGSTGFTAGFGASIMGTLATTRITPASGTVCGYPWIQLAINQFMSFGTGTGTNYDCVIGVDPSTLSHG